jgi:uncharacterized protein (UPF0548 family)
MFLLTRPSADQVRQLLAASRHHAFSYPEAGMTRRRPPSGYRADRNRILLGNGATVFAAAVAALRRWKMFDLGWLELIPADAPIEVNVTVCVRVWHFGFWSLNACRIVYVIDEDESVKRYGFAYGTLTDHAERGEERFTIEWNREDDSVCYDILAYSQPRHPLARLGYPLARMMQKRFARDSKQAMRRAVHIGQDE